MVRSEFDNRYEETEEQAISFSRRRLLGNIAKGVSTGAANWGLAISTAEGFKKVEKGHRMRDLQLRSKGILQMVTTSGIVAWASTIVLTDRRTFIGGVVGVAGIMGAGAAAEVKGVIPEGTTGTVIEAPAHVIGKITDATIEFVATQTSPLQPIERSAPILETPPPTQTLAR